MADNTVPATGIPALPVGTVEDLKQDARQQLEKGAAIDAELLQLKRLDDLRVQRYGAREIYLDILKLLRLQAVQAMIGKPVEIPVSDDNGGIEQMTIRRVYLRRCVLARANGTEIVYEIDHLPVPAIEGLPHDFPADTCDPDFPF